MLVLRDLPNHHTLEALSQRIPQVDPVAVEAMLWTLRVASDMIAALESHMARYGLSQGRFAVLMLLIDGTGEGSTPSVLAERAGVTRATMTGLLDGLERDGLIVREPATKDRRNVFIHLTDKGREFMEAVLPDHFQRVSDVMRKLDDTEMTTLLNLLAKINRGIPEFLRP
jgi:DNA-binding MarR family transcriptional regulator